ncbi:hypothetical protein [Paenibacillus sp. GYB003]|uniref:hypothetical protein n=1 Tax=Paenibacillus sp. GYB003 TaxID=2994392 RepID=UPI002F96B4E2
MNKRVAAVITEYWDISHADVIITKMLDGFRMDGRLYASTIDIVSFYVDKFPPNDLSRETRHSDLWHDSRSAVGRSSRI